jgi:hypothetical protein
MADQNPYESGNVQEADAIHQSKTVSVICFLSVYLPTFFVPTIEAFQLDYSLGRIPVWYSYVGLLAPEFWNITIPIVIAHVTISMLLSSWMSKLYLARRFSS